LYLFSYNGFHDAAKKETKNKISLANSKEFHRSVPGAFVTNAHVLGAQLL
jgi:hypothetical protein